MARIALLLDEMHDPKVAQALVELGHDVVAVVDRPDLRALSDGELLHWAHRQGRGLVTENVKDFRRLLAEWNEPSPPPAVLYTASRIFPRSRRNPGPLIKALGDWLRQLGDGVPPRENWLRRSS